MKKNMKTAEKSPLQPALPDVLGGHNPSGTTAGCPTGLATPENEAAESDTNVRATASPGKNEDEIERSDKPKDSRGQDIG